MSTAPQMWYPMSPILQFSVMSNCNVDALQLAIKLHYLFYENGWGPVKPHTPQTETESHKLEVVPD
jgi:hypothetical protein